MTAAHISLNIGLDGNPYADAPDEAWPPLMLRTFGQARTGWRFEREGYSLEWDTPDRSRVTEPTAVVGFRYVCAGLRYAPTLAEALAMACDALCVLTCQDCVALVARVDGEKAGRGFLLGPRADAWGAFDPRRFEYPSHIQRALVRA